MTAIIGQHLALQTIIKYDSEAYLMRMISAIKKYYHYIELWLFIPDLYKYIV